LKVLKEKKYTSKNLNITDRIFLVWRRRCSFVGILWIISSTSFRSCCKKKKKKKTTDMIELFKSPQKTTISCNTFSA